VQCLTDGRRLVALPAAQDHKRVGDGDTGPNTGGMGAYSPVAAIDESTTREIVECCVQPVLTELARRGIDYRGVLYAGLMLTESGPKVLEFNVRFGDPETQAVLPRLDGDVAALLAQCAAGELVDEPDIRPDAAVSVVLSAGGYPGPARSGDVIEGLDHARAMPGVELFFAGVAGRPDGALVTAGGRVLAVTATAPTVDTARALAYAAADAIHWPGRHFRSDIAASESAAELAP
jgi:phosphoribosylamine--glycine ligase